LILNLDETLMSQRFDRLRIRQLDRSLVSSRPLEERRPPQGGWARAIREALGMSQRQLAERMGVSKTTVYSAERNEARGTIKLESLTALADGLDCDLVYAFVPRESLAATLERRAEEVAGKLVEAVSTSMELEEQGVPDEERRRQVAELASELLAKRPADFWDD
jgi:predicted DNA-binding mobile mystery protein A